MVPKCFGNIVCVIVGLLCASSYGEELPDLIARLQKLEGISPLRGVVHVEERTPGTEDKGSQQLETADLTITADANALTLMVTGDISDAEIFREFSLLRASELVHYGPSLVRELAGLKLVEKLPDLHEGTPCTRWRLHSEEKRSQFGMSASRRRDVELWIDADGYPTAASFQMQNQSKMLLFKQTLESRREQRYKRLGGRLILILEKLQEPARRSKVKGAKRIVTTTVEVKKGFG